jgi:hypothetical protein
MSIIVDIDHETGDLTQYTSTVTDSGDLSVHADGSLGLGSYGLKCVIDDQTAIYGQKTITGASGTLRARFYIDPNTLTMGDTEAFFTFIIVASGPSTSVASVTLYYLSASDYYVQFLRYNDAGYVGGDSVSISDGPHIVELRIDKAATNVSADGTLYGWVDGVQACAYANLDNFDSFGNINSVRLGAPGGLDAGTSGTFYLDELIVNDDGGEIGGVGPVITVGGTDITDKVLIESLSLSQTAEAGAKVATASFIVRDDDASETIAAKAAVTMIDGGITHFAGEVAGTPEAEEFKAGGLDYHVECQDYNQLAHETVVTGSTWAAGGTSDADIIDSLWTTYRGEADVNSTTNVTEVVAAGDMPAFSCYACSLADAMDQLCEITGARWYIDFDKNLHYFATSGTTSSDGLSDSYDDKTTYRYWNLTREGDVGLVNAVYVLGMVASSSGWRTDATSVAAYGSREIAVKDEDIITEAGRNDRGDAILTANKDPKVSYELLTQHSGFSAGEKIPLTSSVFSLSASALLCKEIQTTFLTGEKPIYHIKLGDEIITTPQVYREREGRIERIEREVTDQDTLTIRGWSHDLTFSPQDHNTVEWTSGTIHTAGGSGDFSIAASLTVLQTSTTASNAIGRNKILVCVASNNADTNKYAIYQPFGSDRPGGSFVTADVIAADTITGNEIAANTIDTSELAANCITTNELSANCVEASHINVATLSAISANMGTITAGTITGGTIQTASSGARIVLNTTSLSGYNATPTLTFQLNTDGSGQLGASGENPITWNSSGQVTELTAAQIGTNSITTDELAANAVEAGHINVATLSAIAADMGSLTAGTINMYSNTWDVDATGFRLNATEIASQTSGTDQIILSAATGLLTAGAGVVTLDAGGIDIDLAAAFAESRSYKFTDGGSLVSSMRGYTGGGTNWLELYAADLNDEDSVIMFHADCSDTYTSTVEARVYQETVEQGHLELRSDDDTATNISYLDISCNEVYFNKGGAAPIVFIADTANADMTLGLTINQAGNDDEALALKSSDVAHGITDILETDTYADFQKAVAASGGLLIRGFTEDEIGLELQGWATNDDTNKDATADAYVAANAYKKSAATHGDPGADANLFAVQKRGASVWIVDEDGDTYRDGSENTFDAWDDVQLVRAFEVEQSPAQVIRSEFDQFLDYDRQALLDAGILSDPKGSNFYNESQLIRLHNGAIWQLHKRCELYERALLDLGVEPALLEA